MADTAAAPAPLYRWNAPGKPVTVSLRLDVVDRLGMEVQTACKSLPRRGLEIGGILLGTTRRIQGSTVVEVQDFEVLESEHAVGPSYLLSADDRRNLEQLLHGRKGSGGLSVIGMFRSHTRKEFAITVEDCDLMASYFPDPSMVFLLIHAVPGKPPAAGFFIWEGRTIRSRTPYREFPFRPAALIGEEPGATETPAAADPLPVQAQPPAPVQRHAWRLGAYTKRWQVAAMAAAGMIGGVTLSGLVQRVPAPVAPASHRISKAPSGGGADRLVEEAATAPVQPVAAAELPPISAPETAFDRAPSPHVKKNERPRSIRPAVFSLDVPPKPAATIAALPDPPQLDEGLPEAPPPPAIGRLLLPAAPGIHDPFVSTSVETLPQGNGSLLGKLFGKRRKQEAFAPPKLVREPQLTVPRELRDRVTGEVRIDVKAYLDQTGKVEYVEMLSNATSRNRDLAALAVFASRRYEFSPARLGDEAAPSSVVLRFRFGPEARAVTRRSPAN